MFEIPSSLKKHKNMRSGARGGHFVLICIKNANTDSLAERLRAARPAACEAAVSHTEQNEAHGLQ